MTITLLTAVLLTQAAALFLWSVMRPDKPSTQEEILLVIAVAGWIGTASCWIWTTP